MNVFETDICDLCHIVEARLDDENVEQKARHLVYGALESDLALSPNTDLVNNLLTLREYVVWCIQNRESAIQIYNQSNFVNESVFRSQEERDRDATRLEETISQTTLPFTQLILKLVPRF